MLKLIYSTAWAKYWGHVPPTEHELRHLVKNLSQIADPELIYVAEIDGAPAGFAVALPNVNRALRAAYPNPRTPEFWTLLKFLWYCRTRVNSCRVILLGVLPEHRMSGIDAVLSFKLLEAAKQKKYIGGEFSWILENNDAMNRVIQLAGSRIYRTYRIYDYAIE
jgi:GNAT superfamily N-acetyltransferase